MGRKPKICLFCFLILWVVTFSDSDVVQAAESIGGQVTTKGKISFYQEETEASSEEKPVTNGKHLPSTGETKKNDLFLIGSIFAVVSVYVLSRKYREEERQ